MEGDFDGNFNEVVITLSFAQDKWMGGEGWQRDVKLLLELARSLDMDYGRRKMAVEYRNQPVDEELDWSE